MKVVEDKVLANRIYDLYDKFTKFENGSADVDALVLEMYDVLKILGDDKKRIEKDDRVSSLKNEPSNEMEKMLNRSERGRFDKALDKLNKELDKCNAYKSRFAKSKSEGDAKELANCFNNLFNLYTGLVRFLNGQRGMGYV